MPSQPKNSRPPSSEGSGDSSPRSNVTYTPDIQDREQEQEFDVTKNAGTCKAQKSAREKSGSRQGKKEKKYRTGSNTRSEVTWQAESRTKRKKGEKAVKSNKSSKDYLMMVPKRGSDSDETPPSSSNSESGGGRNSTSHSASDKVGSNKATPNHSGSDTESNSKPTENNSGSDTNSKANSSRDNTNSSTCTDSSENIDPEHLLKIAKATPCSCPGCRKRFSSKIELLTHIQAVHSVRTADLKSTSSSTNTGNPNSSIETIGKPEETTVTCRRTSAAEASTRKPVRKRPVVLVDETAQTKREYPTWNRRVPPWAKRKSRRMQ
mmetsp:Transcript_6015/g.8341  ORF Transcript_6015/g.8341 Transcript_6015/m.8341 type:complete len:321 (-) Transcript_6015:354-1316(-)